MPRPQRVVQVSTGSSPVLPQPLGKVSVYRHEDRGARERVTDMPPESTKRELENIHRRRSNVRKNKKKRHSTRRVHPLHYEKVDQTEQSSSCHGVENDVDMASYTKDYIQLAREHKREEKYRVYPHQRMKDAHRPRCALCSRRDGEQNKVWL